MWYDRLLELLLPRDRLERALRIATHAMLVSILAIVCTLLLAWWHPFIPDAFEPLRLRGEPMVDREAYAAGDTILVTIERCNDGLAMDINVTLALTRLVESGGERAAVAERDYQRFLSSGCSTVHTSLAIPPEALAGSYRVNGFDTAFSTGDFQVQTWHTADFEVR